MDLFEEIVNESMLLTELNKSRESDVIQAINKMLRVRISYSDKKGGKGKKERFIYPVAYGLTKRGNPAIRAFQTAGSTKRGVPKWKLFLFDNIFAWSNGKRSFKEHADKLVSLGFNKNGDKGLTKIFAISPLANGDIQVADDNDISTATTKDDINPTSDLQNPNLNKSDKYISAQQQRAKTLDIEKPSQYNSIKNIEAPSTKAFTKNDVVTQNEPEQQQQQQQQQTNVDTMNHLDAQETKPITKTDIIEPSETENDKTDNELTRKFNDLTDRMNNLYNNEED